MHDCPECYQACACDGEDTWLDSESDHCIHECEEYDDDDNDYEYDAT